MAAADRAHVSRRRVHFASTPHLKPRSPKAPSEHRLFMLTILLCEVLGGPMFAVVFGS